MRQLVRIPYTLTAALLCALACPAVAEPARVTHVVDGDTLYVELRGAEVKVRVADLDTPEVAEKAKCEAERLAGERASTFVKALMPVGKVVDLQPTGKREKHGRLLAAVIVDGRDYATMLVERGLGVRYGGETKPRWCG